MLSIRLLRRCLLFLFVSALLLLQVGCQQSQTTTANVQNTSSTLLDNLLQQSDVPSGRYLSELSTTQKEEIPTSSNENLAESADRMFAYRTNQDAFLYVIHRLRRYTSDEINANKTFITDTINLINLAEAKISTPEFSSSIPVIAAQCVQKEAVAKFCGVVIKHGNVLSGIQVIDPFGAIDNQSIEGIVRQVTTMVDQRAQ